MIKHQITTQSLSHETWASLEERETIGSTADRLNSLIMISQIM